MVIRELQIEHLRDENTTRQQGPRQDSLALCGGRGSRRGSSPAMSLELSKEAPKASFVTRGESVLGAALM